MVTAYLNANMDKEVYIKLPKICEEVLKQGLLKIKYVPTAANIADIFTKPLPSPRFRLLRDELVSDVQVFINNGASAMSKLLVTDAI